ncbi:uncharacterized protein LOC126304670 [Schistocerca gregaria]|uniref:uncharacterized protein LOC126304670 n=1 Tax=Schistocerca gregaria TaxID=7010 RepID=UPI00211ED034|nr:uncharacterized protein LOC126304670 [Schistocerca gregaria]
MNGAPLGTAEPELFDKEVQWSQLGLDPRIERAVKKIGWSSPTLVQSKSISFALQGKDVLAKARTGSGKTAAYLIPIIQNIISLKESPNPEVCIRSLVLVPTRELCQQVSEVVGVLTRYCRHLVKCIYLASDLAVEAQKIRINSSPDIVIATPGRLVQHLEQDNIDLRNLKYVVVDEADLVLAYGYKQDIERISQSVPKICQGFLASATLSSEASALMNLILHNPVVLKLTECVDSTGHLVQYFIASDSLKRYFELYVMLKLNMVSGKTLIFVNSIKECYRLKVFLRRLSFRVAALSSDLPVNSRYSMIQQFNQGKFDLLIATDEINVGLDSEEASDGREASTNRESDEPTGASGPQEISALDGFDRECSEIHARPDDERRAQFDSGDGCQGSEDDGRQLEECSVESDHARRAVGAGESAELSEQFCTSYKDALDTLSMIEEKGRNISESSLKLVKEKLDCIQDRRMKFPQSELPYVRADAEYGVSRGIDFKSVSNVINFDFPASVKSYVHRVGRTARGKLEGVAISFYTPEDQEICSLVAKHQSEHGSPVHSYSVNSGLVESFRYRVEPIVQGLTRSVIRNARFKELKREILNNEKLASYFKEHPQDLQALCHVNSKKRARKNTLHFIPDYLLPKEQVKSLSPVVVLNRPKQAVAVPKRKKKFQDPLVSFKYKKKASKCDLGGGARKAPSKERKRLSALFGE